jgi:hypothetical protein
MKCTLCAAARETPDGLSPATIVGAGQRLRKGTGTSGHSPPRQNRHRVHAIDFACAAACDYRVIAAARKLMHRINLTTCKVIRLA